MIKSQAVSSWVLRFAALAAFAIVAAIATGENASAGGLFDTCSIEKGYYCNTQYGIGENEYCRETGSSFQCETCCKSDPKDVCHGPYPQGAAGLKNCDNDPS